MNFSLTYYRDGDRTITLADDAWPVAIFTRNPAGEMAYALFVHGLATAGTCTLRDKNTGEFIVGTLDQLDAA